MILLFGLMKLSERFLFIIIHAGKLKLQDIEKQNLIDWLKYLSESERQPIATK